MLAQLNPIGPLKPQAGSGEYSTDEKVVGKWIDGKNIYRKVIISTVGEIQNDLNDLGADQVVSFYGEAETNYQSWFPIPCKNHVSIDYNNADNYTISILQSAKAQRNFQITFGNYYNSGNGAKIIIEYTKKGE